MILTPGIIARIAALGALVAVAQVVCFAKMDVFGTSPDIALLVVISVGLLGGSLTGAVTGFSIGLLLDCLLLETMGAFALTLLSVGYVAGRYRETVGRPTRPAVALARAVAGASSGRGLAPACTPRGWSSRRSRSRTTSRSTARTATKSSRSLR